MKQFFSIVMKGLIILTFVLALVGLLREDLIKIAIEWIRQSVLGLGNWNYLIVFISSLIESFPVLGVVVPGQNILLIAGGFFAEQSKQHLFFVILISGFGAICGNYIGYILGRFYGEDFFKQYGFWFGIGETELRYLKSGIEKWGPFGVILGKFHNLSRAFIPFIAGSTGMKSTKFMLYNIIGSFIRSLVIVLLGVVFAKTYEIIIDYLGYAMMGIFLVGALYIWSFKKEAFLSYLKEKNEEIERKSR